MPSHSCVCALFENRLKRHTKAHKNTQFVAFSVDTPALTSIPVTMLWVLAAHHRGGFPRFLKLYRFSSVFVGLYRYLGGANPGKIHRKTDVSRVNITGKVTSAPPAIATAERQPISRSRVWRLGIWIRAGGSLRMISARRRPSRCKSSGG